MKVVNNIIEKFNNLNKKTKIIIGVVFLLIVLVSSFLIARSIMNKKTEPEAVVNYNTNSEILKEHEIGGLLIHDISLQMTDGQSNFRAKATNKTDKNIDFEGLELTFYDEKGELGKVRVFQTRTIVPNETIDLVNYTDMDFTKASSVKYEIVSE